ncbi:hypothetical protein MNBD_PLANCTO02-3251 [hydrothermal vent metagenome]|uniref:DUF485 domain-containing protein n=1 Tax=hydrothermal vent metagenome TaxID=652676 RepID=A0A3B1E195_9ZZZZ
MAGMDHGANQPDANEDSKTVARNTRYGLTLFAVYLVLYGGFVLLNTFAPATMENMLIGGISLAVVYGFVLIAAAFVLALVYGWLCRLPVSSSSQQPSQKQEKN